MKVLVATKETQGWRKNDFSFCEEGELVRFGFECSGEKVDGHCGCRRSMAGMKTFKATTTMRVVEKDMTRVQFENELLQAMKKSGWQNKDAVLEGNKLIQNHAKELLKMASAFPVGTVIEKRGTQFRERITLTTPSLKAKQNRLKPIL